MAIISFSWEVLLDHPAVCFVYDTTEHILMIWYEGGFYMTGSVPSHDVVYLMMLSVTQTVYSIKRLDNSE
jgi:hypothetical protein